MNLRHALKWSFFAQVAAKAVQPVVYIVLARLLSPEDFGVMTAALMIIGFSQIFWEAGMGKALIQRQSNVEEAANAAFWVNFSMAIVIAILLLIIADPIAHIFFKDPRVTLVVQVMTIQILLGAISSVHTALLQKKMEFKKLFWVRLISSTLPGIASIPLAMGDMSYWALVAGSLFGSVASGVVLWNLSPWRPSLSFNVPVAMEMYHFGKWVLGSGLLVWFYAWADSLIVGMYLGSHDLGLYRLGNLITSSVVGLVVAPLMPVAYSYLSHRQYQGEELNEKVLIGEKLLAMFLFPLIAVLILSSELVADLLFGEKWQGISTVIMLVALCQGIAYTVNMKQLVYRSMGKPEIETKIMFISMLIRLPFYLLFARFGLMAFLVGRLVAVNFGVINHLIFAKRILGLRFMLYVKTVGVPALAAIAAVLSGMISIEYSLFGKDGEVLATLLGVAISLLVYIVIVSILDRKFLVVILRRFILS